MAAYYVAESSFEEVARIYSAALLRGETPYRAIKQELGLTQKQAEYRVRTARKKGLLPSAIGPGQATGSVRRPVNARVALVAEKTGIPAETVSTWPSMVIDQLLVNLP
jgi:hypothetical protein